MNPAKSVLGALCCSFVAALLAVFSLPVLGQQAPAPPEANAQSVAAAATQPKNWTAAEDHRNMMDQLGIKALRPGPSGNEKAPDHANYDEAKANPFPNLPDVLTLKNGKKVTTAKMWWTRRRPQIVEDFEREVYGRVPKYVPPVTWTVASTTNTTAGAIPVIEKQLVGREPAGTDGMFSKYLSGFNSANEERWCRRFQLREPLAFEVSLRLRLPTRSASRTPPCPS